MCPRIHRFLSGLAQPFLGLLRWVLSAYPTSASATHAGRASGALGNNRERKHRIFLDAVMPRPAGYFRFLTLTSSVSESPAAHAAVAITSARYSEVFFGFCLSEKLP
jgi:hypothetical protein